jgi:hydroxyacylglutathione hydrolase
MFLKPIKTEGLAHFSYLIGDGGKAAVIDPRRDCAIYVDIARRHGLEITHVLETHRNEDLISGAPILKEMTGARVVHGPKPAAPVAYADTVREGDSLELGDIRITVLETPGHTDDHVAYVIHDTDYPDGAVGVFTGDALFIGDVARTDFYPDRAREVAGLLFDSLRKLEALGDHVIIYPAHGAGSVCGAGMAKREFSTIGHERRNNPRLKIRDRDEFIAVKTAEHHYLPPYFKHMERLNLQGAAAARIGVPRILSLKELAACNADRLLDIRPVTSYAGAHFPDSIAMPVAAISAYAGWFLQEHDRIALVAEDAAQASQAVEHLTRIGYDDIVGVYIGVLGAAAAGRVMETLPMIDSSLVKERLAKRPRQWTLLDVRSQGEVESYAIEGARHIYLGHLAERVEELDRSSRYTVMCGSGQRATIGASWLKTHGITDVDVFLGSAGAWRARHAA